MLAMQAASCSNLLAIVWMYDECRGAGREADREAGSAIKNPLIC